MSSLFGSKAQKSKSASEPPEGEESKSASEPPEASGEDDEEAQSSLKSLQRRVPRTGHRGSLLHGKNDEREDYLHKLFVKRRLKDLFLGKLGANALFSSKTKSQDRPMSEVSDLTLSDLADDSVVGKLDESFLKECHDEVKKEMDKDEDSAKIKEINSMMRDYRPILAQDSPLEVRMENVTYTVPVDDEASNKIMTVYNSSHLYEFNKFAKRVLKCQGREKKEVTFKNILADINLIFKPGRQYLILGPPGAGKSTLLKAITDHIQLGKNETLSGSISYNGRTLEESKEFYIENAFAYIDELDKHAPRLTVAETFEFACQCKTGGKLVQGKGDAELNELDRKANKEHVFTKVVLAALDLAGVKDTFVGDTNVRGVSGGQRRRVTVGEMVMSRATILCGDEISNGLDAASTYDMIQVLLHYGRMRLQSRIIALLQPSPETVSLFDDVIVLSEGQIIYAGPIEQVQDYFANIGFQAPEFTDVADFLIMVASEDGPSLYHPPESIKAVRPNAPTPTELAEIFRASDIGCRIVKDLVGPLPFVWKEEDSSNQLSEVSNLSMSESVRRKYANTFPRSTVLNIRRFIILWLRDKRVIIAGAIKNVIMGVSVGGVFFNTDDVFSIQGALFQAGMFIMLGSMQSSSSLLQDRIIYYKHTDANFYSAWPFIFGRTLSQMPQTFADTVTFSTILYFMIGLADRESASNFFIYLSILITFAVLMNAQMALFASMFDAGTVQAIGSCISLALFLFGGFIIAPDTIPTYWIWVYWWNPYAWAYRALLVNEFRSGTWPDPDQILTDIGFIDPQGDPYSQSWVGYSFAYMVPYFLLCIVLSAVGLTYVRGTGGRAPTAPTSKESDSPDDDEVEEKLVIPFKPVTLSFQDLGYEVTASTSKEQLMLLKKVNGIFRPGKMCALMGSSGAGKTTLMDVIALRKRSGTVTGEVRLNGWPQDPVSFRRASGYVEQFDVQFPELTVRETVLFSGRLRLDREFVESDKQIQGFVDSIIGDVGLSDLANVLIGTDEGKGLSFEEKKRLSIAVELAASPSILFLDEPTTGLDARAASLVVKTLRTVADSNRSICATIHQPSSAVFSMFDELLLLKTGGQAVFHGPLGENCSNLVSYFESRGAQKISLGDNPANWMLRVITDTENCDFAEAYLNSDDFARLKAELDSLKESPNEDMKIEYDTEFAAPGRKRRELVGKGLRLIYWRSPAYNLTRISVSLVIAFVLGSVFVTTRKLPVYTETDMNARISVIFLCFIITGIMAILAVLPVMTEVRDMYYKQRDAGMYDSGSMGLALGGAEKGFIVLSTVLFSLVFLPTSGFTAGLGKVFRAMVAFWGFFTFNFAIYSYMGQLFVCLVKPMATAMILCSVFIGINNFFSGLIIRPQFMVGGFYAIPYYISPGHYVYEGMVVAVFYENDKKVLANEGSDFYDYLNCTYTQTDNQTECVGTWHEYADVFFGGEFTYDHTLRNALILGGILVATRLGTWIALKYIRFA